MPKRAARAPRRPPTAAPAPGAARPTARPARTARVSGEEPHAHVVCRVCGRIQSLDLSELDRHLLSELSALTPDGWRVERIAYSLAGTCRRCREGTTPA